MIRFAINIYLTAFTMCFRAGGSAWSSNINIWKGVTGVALIESAFVLGTAASVSVFFDKNVLPNMSKLAVIISFLFLCATNYYLLVLRGDGIRFEREFDNHEKSMRLLLQASCVAVILGAMAFFVYSGIAYRRFLGIDSP